MSRLRFGEAFAEHRQTADGLCLCCFVLKYVPMFGENTVGDAAHVHSVAGGQGFSLCLFISCGPPTVIGCCSQGLREPIRQYRVPCVGLKFIFGHALE